MASASCAAIDMRRDRGVFPGDHLCAIGDLAQVLLGPGVARDGDFLVASRAGVLRWEAERSRLWVDNDQKRYVPALGDHVIGVVVEKHAEEYRLRVGAAALATLPTLAFDGATKRNRPHLEVGTLVYARVVLANKDMEPEVSCAAPPGVGAKDWVTKESVFGELEGGNVFDCPQALCRELLATDSAVLDALGGVAPFELAIGVNGRVWIAATDVRHAILVQHAVLQSQAVRDDEAAELVDHLKRQLDAAADGYDGTPRVLHT